MSENGNEKASKHRRRQSSRPSSIWIFAALVVVLALIFRGPLSDAINNPNKNLHFKFGLEGFVFESLKSATLQRSDEDKPAPGYEQRASDAAKKAEANAGQVSGKSILWIDDQPRNNSFLQNAFTAVGIRVFQALSNEEAIELLKQDAFDLAITDVRRTDNLGDENGAEKGLEMIPRLTEKGVPFIVYSGSWSGSHIGQEDQYQAKLITNDPSEVYSEVIKTLSLPRSK